MKIQTALLSFLIAGATCSSAFAQTQLTLKDLAGPQSCGGTIYKWPTRQKTEPTRVGDAMVKVVGDGNGNWTRGTAKAGNGSQTVCELSLAKGTYTINPDGTFESDISWKISSGDATACANFVSYFSGMMQPDSSFTSRVIVYPAAKKVGYQFGHGPLGFGVGKCELGPH